MIGNLLLRSIDRMMTPNDDKIYLMLNGDIERLPGGKYVENPQVLLEKIVGAVAVRGGHFNLSREINGIKYKGLEEYHVPVDEIDKLRITKDDMPRLMLVNAGAVFRVVDYQRVWSMRTVRLWVEKTKDTYPVTHSAWTFEDDTVGEHPTGWIVNDPTTTTLVGVFAAGYGNPGKYVIMRNEVLDPGDPYPSMLLAASDHLGGPFIKVKWRVYWKTVVDDTGYCGFDWAGKEESPFATEGIGYLGIHRPSYSEGGVRYLDPSETIMNVLLLLGEWYTFEVKMDRVGNVLSIDITRESTSESIFHSELTYDPFLMAAFGLDHPLDFPPAMYFGFSGTPIDAGGRAGERLIDDVEVWATA